MKHFNLFVNVCLRIWRLGPYGVRTMSELLGAIEAGDCGRAGSVAEGFTFACVVAKDHEAVRKAETLPEIVLPESDES